MLEGGVSNAIGFSGLEVGLDILLGLGIENISKHIDSYIANLEEDMIALGFESLRCIEAKSSILSVMPPKNTTVMDLIPKYSQFGVCITGPDGLLRIAPHWSNPLQESNDFIEITKKVLKS